MNWIAGRILLFFIASVVDNFGRRFRQIPSFGKDTIRRFSNNVSELKRSAARDLEDILQV
jgi:hypothetical protein